MDNAISNYYRDKDILSMQEFVFFHLQMSLVEFFFIQTKLVQQPYPSLPIKMRRKLEKITSKIYHQE